MTNNFNEYKKLLSEFVSFKSISTDNKYKNEIDKTVSWLKTILKSGGFNVSTLDGKNSNPVVLAKYNVNQNAKTLLIYGHYDVQPAEKEDGWTSDPYKLSEKGNKLVGRGVVDNKGQILVHVYTALNLIKQNKLKHNLIFLIEGNEETSNPDLSSHLKKLKKELKCDYVVVSDGELTNNKPTIEISLRGGFNSTIKYQTGKNNLHSGIYGGAVPNAAHEINKLLQKLFNSDGSVTFKDFYINVATITKAELKNNRKLMNESVDIKKIADVYGLSFTKDEDFFTKTGLTPTIQITGLKSGYIGDGYANIVPSTAEARLNFRTVAFQNSRQIAKAFEKFVKRNTPKYVKFKLEFEGFHDPIKVDTNSLFVSQSEKILEKIYKTNVNRKNVGGAIPFVADCKNILGVDTLLIPLCNEDCNMHGTDENFDIDLIKKALDFSYSFLKI